MVSVPPVEQGLQELREVLEGTPIEIEAEHVCVKSDPPEGILVAIQEPPEAVRREEAGAREHEEVMLRRAEQGTVPVEHMECAVVGKQQVGAPEVGVAEDLLGVTERRQIAQPLQALDTLPQLPGARHHQVAELGDRRIGTSW